MPKVKIAQTDAERSRRKRANRSNGIVCLTVKVSRAELEDALQLARGFTEAQLHDRALVQAELSEVLTIWFERWIRLRHA